MDSSRTSVINISDKYFQYPNLHIRVYLTEVQVRIIAPVLKGLNESFGKRSVEKWLQETTYTTSIICQCTNLGRIFQ